MIKTWYYQLQNIDPATVGSVYADVKVVDFSRDGTVAGAFTAAEVDQMRGAPSWPTIPPGFTHPSPPRVLSYISIGEAETYRTYWQPAWLKQRPLWLSDENPDWPGNYKVEFWNGDWKHVIYDYLDEIMGAGFDGVYLDIIDAYEYWEEFGVHDAGNRMIRFVREIAAYCQERRPGFWIVPQNGEELLHDRTYVSAIDAIAKEDLLFGIDGDDVRNESHASLEAKQSLDIALAHGKPVLTVEYVSKKANVTDVMGLHREWGFVPYVTVRDLDRPTPPLARVPA